MPVSCSLGTGSQLKTKSLLNPPTVVLEPAKYLKLSWFIMSMIGHDTAFLDIKNYFSYIKENKNENL